MAEITKKNKVYVSNVSTVAAERAVIGLVLSQESLFERVRISYTADDFTNSSLKTIFEVCLTFAAGGRVFSWESIADALTQVENRPVELQNPISFVSDLVSNAPSAEQLGFFLGLLSERQVRSNANAAADEFKNLLADPSVSAEDMYAAARKIEDCFQSVEVGKVLVADPSTFWNLIEPGIQTIMHSNMIGTGFERIDKHLAFGFTPGVSTIAGRPTMGKSTFRANIQRLLSMVGVNTITIAREQSLLDEYFRLIAIQTGMSVQTLVRGLRAVARNEDPGQFNAEMFQTAVDYLENPKRPHVYIEPRGMFFLKDIRRYVEEYRRKGNDPKIVFVDLFNQLDDFRGVFDPGKKAGMIGQKMIEAGNLARELQTHICCIVQLRRLGKDKGKVDRQELYKESGAFEERCDLMFQVERPAYYKDDIPDNTIQVYIGKQRMGERARTIDLLWDPQSMRIEDQAPPEGSEEDEELGGRTF